jgi:hypothetical protein
MLAARFKLIWRQQEYDKENAGVLRGVYKKIDVK